MSEPEEDITVLSTGTQCPLTKIYDSRNVYHMGNLKLQAKEGNFYSMNQAPHRASAGRYVFQSSKGSHLYLFSPSSLAYPAFRSLG